MSIYSKIELTATEQRFVDSFMDKDAIHPQSPTYWEIMKKFLTKWQTDHANKTAIITEAVATLSENILYKIYAVEADEAIEQLLDGTITGMVNKPHVKRAVRARRTSRLSLDQFLVSKADSVDALVLKSIQDNPHISRNELASTLNIRLCTICGCVRRLYNEDLIRVSGVKLDETSNRNVETLEVR